jgi:hypothetical protein
MKETLIKNWSFMRLLRLVLGAFIAYDGFRTHEYLIMSMGLLFMGLSVMNVGCCGVQGCGVPSKQANTTEPEEVQYEEVK